MFRSIVRTRPSWPRVKAGVSPSSLVVAAQCQPFHSTAPAGSLGFKNFKSTPRLDWKIQQDMDAKNAKANAKRPPRVSYAEALKSHQPRAWVGARKKIVWGRLFGGGNSGEQSGGD